MRNESDIERFVEEIQNKIDYFRKEYSLTYSEVIGALEIIKYSLFKEAGVDGED